MTTPSRRAALAAAATLTALAAAACAPPTGPTNPISGLAACPREVQVITIRDNQQPYCDLLGRPTHQLNLLITIGEDVPEQEAIDECNHHGGTPSGVITSIVGGPDELFCPNIDY